MHNEPLVQTVVEYSLPLAITRDRHPNNNIISSHCAHTCRPNACYMVEEDQQHPSEALGLVAIASM